MLLIYAVSFILIPTISMLQNLVAHSPLQEAAINDIEVVNTVAAPFAKPMWGTILIWIFIAGMAAVAIKTAIIWVRLINVIHSGKKIEQGECILAVVDNERFAPFS